MNIKQVRDYYNTKPVEFIIRENYELKEDNTYVPRFQLKNIKNIADIPVNEPLKPTQEIILKAIIPGSGS